MSRVFCLVSTLALLTAASAARAQETVFRYSFFSGQDLTTPVFDEGPAGNNALGQPGALISVDVPTESLPDDTGDASLDSAALGGVVTENVSLLTNDAIATAGGFVMECWFKWNGGGTVNSIVDYAGTEKIVLAGASGELAMLISGTGRVPIGIVAPGEWHYVAVVFDTLGEPLTVDGFATGTLSCYLDSFSPAVVRAGAVKDNFGDSLVRPIGVGQHPLGFAADFFDGLVFEPRVTLGVPDLEELLLDARVVNAPSTLLAYRFSADMPLPAIVDAGGAGNDATAAAGASLDSSTPPATVEGGGDSSLATSAGGAVTDAAGLLTTDSIGDTSGFTVEGWILWSGAGAGTVFDLGGGSRVAILSSGRIELVISSSESFEIGQAVADQWHWFGAVFDSLSLFPDGNGSLVGEVTTYFDGLASPVTTTDVELESTDGAGGIGIGQGTDGSSLFPGLIYAPTISLGPLSAGALSYVMPLPEPVTLFRYSEIDASLFPLVPDSSGSGNDATASVAARASEEIPEDGVPDDSGEFSLDSSGGLQANPTGAVTNAISLLSNDRIAEFGGFTMECWIQWNGAGAVNSIIDYAGTEKIVIDERSGENGGLVQMRISGTGDLPIAVATPFEWHYVAVVFATGGQPQNGDGTIGGTVTVYFDGTDPVAVYEGATKDNFGDSLARPIGIGQHPIGFDLDFFEGLTYEPRVTLGPLAPSALLYGGVIEPPDGTPFLRGDCNSDGSTAGVTDAVTLLNYNFLGGAVPTCIAACDVNADGSTAGVTDAVALLNYNFLGGSPPSAPFPNCGVSEAPGDVRLGCLAAAGCAP